MPKIQIVNEHGITMEISSETTLTVENTNNASKVEVKARPEGFHDVLLVAFDIRAETAKDAHEWLHAQMPRCYKDEDTAQGITLDSWWVANDERFDMSDTDSAVFVQKGNQKKAREALARFGLSSGLARGMV